MNHAHWMLYRSLLQPQNSSHQGFRNWWIFATTTSSSSIELSRTGTVYDSHSGKRHLSHVSVVTRYGMKQRMFVKGMQTGHPQIPRNEMHLFLRARNNT